MQYVADGRGGDHDPELRQFSCDSQVTPAGVLPGQVTDQLDVFIGQRRTPGLPVGIGPAFPDDLALPGEQRRRCDEQRRPPLAGEQRPGQCEERPVGPREAGSRRTPVQDLELVTQHDDLDVLLESVETTDTEQLDDTTNKTEEEREGHGRKGSPLASGLVKPGFE